MALLHPNQARRPITAGRTAGRASVTEESSFAEVFARHVIERKKQMKKTLVIMALAIATPFAWAQVSETTTTTTTTEGNGTITQYTPGSAIVLKESSGPRTYHFGKTVTYVTRSGKVLDEDVCTDQSESRRSSPSSLRWHRRQCDG